jgi:uncharacterized membrane protein
LSARLRKLLGSLREAFWLIPALMVLGSVLAAVALVYVDRNGMAPQSLIEGRWLYDGGATGARTLLGAVASSTIAVVGTVFTITIAALSLAAGQMGPRLLRNFTRDRGNQFTLGVFLGTFSYTLMVLRSVRTQSEGEFIPHLSLTVGIALAFVCVGTLVYFVGHMASRINVDTVIDLVSEDLRSAIRRLTTDEPQRPRPPSSFWKGSSPVTDHRRGYLVELDTDGLASWAAEHGTAIKLLVRPGDYVFPGAPIALINGPTDGTDAAIVEATALGSQRSGSADLEFAIRQLVEVAVRALSPGINDPYTVLSVLDRLGAAMCHIAPLHLANGAYFRDERLALLVPNTDYDGLADTMFHLIRQSARGSAVVFIRTLEVLAAVASCERNPERVTTLERHARLVLREAQRDIRTPEDLEDICERYAAFKSVAGGQSSVQRSL